MRIQIHGNRTFNNRNLFFDKMDFSHRRREIWWILRYSHQRTGHRRWKDYWYVPGGMESFSYKNDYHLVCLHQLTELQIYEDQTHKMFKNKGLGSSSASSTHHKLQLEKGIPQEFIYWMNKWCICFYSVEVTANSGYI